MNVIVSNKQKDIIDNANIDVIKDLNGLFSIDDLISKFKNYFFSKMILDATSIINFSNTDVLNKLVNEIGSERLFILLPSSPEPPKDFVDRLINLKVYNFSTKIDDIVKFLNKPNTYEDIMNSMQSNDNFYQDNSIKENDNYSDVNSQNDCSNSDNNNLYFGFDNQEMNDNFDISDNQDINNQFVNNKIVIGIKNVTSHAGSTTLTYLINKALREKYNKRVVCIEVNKDDFKYYQDNTMISIEENRLENVINNNNAEVFIIDLNDCHNLSVCNDILYLVEPSIIKLNALMINNRFAFRELQNKKVVLNQSLLSNSDVNGLSNEAHVNMFMNIPPLNDRIDNDIIVKLIDNLGIK